MRVDSDDPRTCTVMLEPVANGLISGWGDGPLGSSCMMTVLETDARGERSRV